MKKLVLIAGLFLLAGCNTATKPTPENYLKTINAWLPDHPDCLLDGSIKFPYETSDPAQTKQMDTLVKAQVLAVTREPAIKISRYTQTPAGIAAGQRLCYGYRTATGIVSSTPPVTVDGFPQTKVVYSYKIEDVPMWAKTDEVKAAFPTFAHELSGTATDTITLAATRVAWTVPN